MKPGAKIWPEGRGAGLLTTNEREVMSRRLGLGPDGKEHSLDQIAALLRISRQRVLQLQQRALDKLNGVGRPATPAADLVGSAAGIRIYVTLPRAVVEELDALAAAERRSRAGQIAEMVEAALEVSRRPKPPRA